MAAMVVFFVCSMKAWRIALIQLRSCPSPYLEGPQALSEHAPLLTELSAIVVPRAAGDDDGPDTVARRATGQVVSYKKTER